MSMCIIGLGAKNSRIWEWLSVYPNWGDVVRVTEQSSPEQLDGANHPCKSPSFQPQPFVSINALYRSKLI
jgi:hypothetical protein